MKAAVEEVRSGRLGYKAASARHGVPKSTLERRVKNKNQHAVESMKVLGAKKVFADEVENELVQYCVRMEEMFFGLTVTDLRRLAFQLAERNGIDHPFNKETKLAGEDWASSFLRQHPQLSVRQPEATSAARARGFNAVTVGEFFSLLETVMDEKKFSPTRIFNADETGLTTM